MTATLSCRKVGIILLESLFELVDIGVPSCSMTTTLSSKKVGILYIELLLKLVSSKKLGILFLQSFFLLFKYFIRQCHTATQNY